MKSKVKKKKRKKITRVKLLEFKFRFRFTSSVNCSYFFLVVISFKYFPRFPDRQTERFEKTIRGVWNRLPSVLDDIRQEIHRMKSVEYLPSVYWSM